jgi:hypothetical protein
MSEEQRSKNHDSKKSRTSFKTDKVSYGINVPWISFEESISIIKRLVPIGGLQGSQDALSHVMGNSLRSSSYVLKVRALRQFALIDIKEKDYNLSDLAQQIVQPDSEERSTQALFDSFNSHKILRRIWENYRGKILPKEEYLSNWISLNLNIPKDVANSWAKYFMSAARYLNLLHERPDGAYQVLNQISFQKSDAIPEKDEDRQSNSNISPLELSKPIENLQKRSIGEFVESEEWGILNQRKVSGNRKAIFAIPDELSEKDIELIKTILKGIEASLDGLRKSD